MEFIDMSYARIAKAALQAGIAAAVALAALPVNAAPIVLPPGETITLDYDATSETPFFGVAFFLTASDVGAGEEATLQIFGDVGGSGTATGPLNTFTGVGGTSQLYAVTSDILDGLFSVVATAVSGTVTIDVAAWVYKTSWDSVPPIVLQPTIAGQVPEPASLALLGLGLAGLAFARRRRE